MMRKALLIAGTALVLTISPLTYSSGTEDPSLQSLVDQLKEIAEKSRRERAADRWLQNALEDLVVRYDWPWSKELLSEDFSDGDYSRNPEWQVLSGEFWVDGRLGLRSRSLARPEQRPEPESAPKQQDLGQALLGAFMEQAFRSPQQAPQKEESGDRRYEAAVIRAPLQIPNVFAVEAEFSVHNSPSESGQIEFSIHQGSEGSSGYSLIIHTGQRPSVELVSQRDGRVSVIESAEITSVSDGHTHSLAWRRGPDGQVAVLLDGTQLMQLRDRSFRHPFGELRISNRAGDFAVAGIRVHAER